MKKKSLFIILFSLLFSCTNEFDISAVDFEHTFDERLTGKWTLRQSGNIWGYDYYNDGEIIWDFKGDARYIITNQTKGNNERASGNYYYFNNTDFDRIRFHYSNTPEGNTWDYEVLKNEYQNKDVLYLSISPESDGPQIWLVRYN